MKNVHAFVVMFGIMGIAGGILRLAVFCLIAVAALCAIRWFVKNTKNPGSPGKIE
jgi:hypothetical protein